MEIKATIFLLAAVIGQAHSLSYPDTFQACMKEFNLEKDDALKSYMSNGKFASDQETASLKCFFSCLTSKLGISDASGNLDGSVIKSLAKENPNESELVVFASDDVQKACIPIPAKYTGTSASACDTVFGFTACALETQAQLQKKSTP